MKFYDMLQNDEIKFSYLQDCILDTFKNWDTISQNYLNTYRLYK
jgi:hypothetical protein